MKVLANQCLFWQRKMAGYFIQKIGFGVGHAVRAHVVVEQGGVVVQQDDHLVKGTVFHDGVPDAFKVEGVGFCASALWVFRHRSQDVWNVLPYWKKINGVSFKTQA